jgi:hypothetical protein
MCLAIAPNTQCSNGLFAKVWRRISLTPLRLFSFAAIFHLLAGSGILIYSDVSGVPVNKDALLSGFTYGVLALPVFGFLMTWWPKIHSLSPVHYGRYSSVYLFMMVSLIMLEAGSIFSIHLVELGMLLLIPGWMIALQGLWDLHGWIKSSAQHFSRALLMLLFLNAAILVYSVTEQYVDLPVPAIISYFLILFIWPIIFIVMAFYVIKTSSTGRIISL